MRPRQHPPTPSPLALDKINVGSASSRNALALARNGESPWPLAVQALSVDASYTYPGRLQPPLAPPPHQIPDAFQLIAKSHCAAVPSSSTPSTGRGRPATIHGDATSRTLLPSTASPVLSRAARVTMSATAAQRCPLDPFHPAPFLLSTADSQTADPG